MLIEAGARTDWIDIDGDPLLSVILREVEWDFGPEQLRSIPGLNYNVKNCDGQTGLEQVYKIEKRQNLKHFLIQQTDLTQLSELSEVIAADLAKVYAD